VHVVGRDDVYPVRTSKVGCLLHCVIAIGYDVVLTGCLLHYAIAIDYDIVLNGCLLHYVIAIGYGIVQ